MPENPALATPFWLAFIDLLNQCLYAKHLRIASGNLSNFSVEKDKKRDKLQQALLGEEAD